MKTETCSCCVILINYISCNTIMLHCAIYIHFINYWKHKVDVTPKKNERLLKRDAFCIPVTSHQHYTWPPCAAGRSVMAALSLVLCRLFLWASWWSFGMFRDIAVLLMQQCAQMLATDRPAGSAKADHEVEIADCCSVWIMREAVWRKHINWQFLRGLKL